MKFRVVLGSLMLAFVMGACSGGGSDYVASTISPVWQEDSDIAAIVEEYKDGVASDDADPLDFSDFSSFERYTYKAKIGGSTIEICCFRDTDDKVYVMTRRRNGSRASDSIKAIDKATGSGLVGILKGYEAIEGSTEVPSEGDYTIAYIEHDGKVEVVNPIDLSSIGVDYKDFI